MPPSASRCSRLSCSPGTWATFSTWSSATARRLPSVLEIFVFTLPVAFTYTIPMGVLVGILIGLSRLAADSEITAMRASGIGVWTFLRVDFHLCGDRLGAGDVQRRVPRARIASRAGPARGPAQGFAGVFRSAAASFLRGLSQARALRAGREDRARRRHLEGRFHRRHQQRRRRRALRWPGKAFWSAKGRRCCTCT